MEIKKEKPKCEHEYKMGNDLGLIKICHKCGSYFTVLINQKTKTDELRKISK